MSFENTQEDSPAKGFNAYSTVSSFNVPDSQLIKENVIETSFSSVLKGGERQGMKMIGKRNKVL